MRTDYALLIFDWDGTLADSTAQIVEGVQHAFAVEQLPPPTTAEVRYIIGLSLSEAVYRFAAGFEPCANRGGD